MKNQCCRLFSVAEFALIVQLASLCTYGQMWQKQMSPEHFRSIANAENLAGRLAGTFHDKDKTVVVTFTDNGGVLTADLEKGPNEGFIAFAEPVQDPRAAEIAVKAAQVLDALVSGDNATVDRLAGDRWFWQIGTTIGPDYLRRRYTEALNDRTLSSHRLVTVRRKPGWSDHGFSSEGWVYESIFELTFSNGEHAAFRIGWEPETLDACGTGLDTADLYATKRLLFLPQRASNWAAFDAVNDKVVRISYVDEKNGIDRKSIDAVTPNRLLLGDTVLYREGVEQVTAKTPALLPSQLKSAYDLRGWSPLSDGENIATLDIGRTNRTALFLKTKDSNSFGTIVHPLNVDAHVSIDVSIQKESRFIFALRSPGKDTWNGLEIANDTVWAINGADVRNEIVNLKEHETPSWLPVSIKRTGPDLLVAVKVGEQWLEHELSISNQNDVELGISVSGQAFIRNLQGVQIDESTKQSKGDDSSAAGSNSNNQQDQQLVADRITAFENGLVPGDDQDKKSTIQSRMAALKVPGMSIAVLRSGRVSWAKSYGLRQAGKSELIDSETVFSVGSLSKFATATLIMRLVSEKRVDLDRDINEFLQRWKIDNSMTRFKKPVVMRNILSHTAGLSVHGFDDFLPGEELPDLSQILNGQPPAKNDPIKLVAEPGTKYMYSGGGYTVAQLVVEEVTHSVFVDAADELLFNALDMGNSTYRNPVPARFSNIAKAHNRSGQPEALPRGWQSMPESAASGLWTTPNDYAKLLIALYESLQKGSDATYLEREIAELMVKPVQPSEYGLGPKCVTKDGERWIEHGGSNDSYKAFFELNLETGRGLVVFTNGANGSRLIKEIRAAIARSEGW